MGLPMYVDRKSKGSDNPNLASLPPDERPRPVVHKSKEEETEEKHWGNTEGNVAAWEVKKVRTDLIRSGMSRRKVAIVDTAIHNAVDERGGQKGMNYGELNETMETLEDNAHKLGLDKKRDLGVIREALEKRL